MYNRVKLFKGDKMAEEKETAQRVMLTMSAKLKDMIDKKADELGINTTQYIINLIINDLKSGKKDI